MSRHANALAQAIHAALSGDPALAARLDASKIVDHAARSTALPLVQLAASEVTDLSGAGGLTEAHRLTIIIRAASRREAGEIARLVAGRLDGAALSPAGCRLVDISWRSTRTLADGKTGTAAIETVFRAVTDA